MVRAGGHGRGGEEVAAAGHFPRDTVGHRGGNHAAEVPACSGRRRDAGRVETGPEQASLLPFLFSLACLYNGRSASRCAVLQPENQKYVSPVHSLTVCQYRRGFFKSFPGQNNALSSAV